MPGSPAFTRCVQENLKKKGFGEKRIKQLTERFDGLVDGYVFEGRTEADANTIAMRQLFGELSDRLKEKGKRAAADLVKAAQHGRGFVEYSRNDAVFGKTNAGTPDGRAAIAWFEHDPRAKHTNYSTELENERGALWAIMSDVLDKVGKGAFGRQMGAAHLPNVIRELWGDDSGDVVAKQIAQSWLKTLDAAVDRFNAAGGSMNKLADYRIGQRQNPAKLLNKEREWTEFHMRALAWDKMRHEDGSPIKVSERAEVLKDVYATLQSGGANKIDPNKYGGKGRSLGNQLEAHRFLVYKDAASWLEQHQRYGDGNVFDVMASHIEAQAHRTALVRVFGSNPEAGIKQIRSMALKRASALGGAVQAKTEAIITQKFDEMAKVVLQRNAMDPHSRFGSAVVGTSNVLTSALLGSASLLAIPGDFITSAFVKGFNQMSPFAGVQFYVNALVTDRKLMRDIGAQSGFVHDSVVNAMYATQRFTGIGTLAPSVTRRLADITMRASLMTQHTEAARLANSVEFMGMFARNAKTKFDKLPFREMLERHSITEEDWNAFRVGSMYEPRPGVKLLRPIDFVQSNDALYRKFQGMMHEEGRNMVPDATIEASVALRGTTRPDTMHGALLHSFAMFKNFPYTMIMTYGRLAMTNPNRAGRVGWVAGLAAAMTLVGAMGIQNREITQGRDPLPMDTATFWGRAALAGGALGIMGDFLFAGVNRFGQGPEETAAGPLVSLAGDVTDLVFGKPFGWVEMSDGLGGKEGVNTAAKAVEFARRYTPVVSALWPARLVIQRYFFDSLAELADPKVYQARRRRAMNRRRQQGNEAWWPEGSPAPVRGPDFGNIMGQ